MFLLGAMLTGSALGFAAGRVASRPIVMLNDDKSMREELARELKLSPEQTVALDTACEWRRARSREIMSAVRQAHDSVRDSARVLMLARLTEAQQETFRKLIERNQRLADSAAKARGTPR